MVPVHSLLHGEHNLYKQQRRMFIPIFYASLGGKHYLNEIIALHFMDMPYK